MAFPQITTRQATDGEKKTGGDAALTNGKNLSCLRRLDNRETFLGFSQEGVGPGNGALEGKKTKKTVKKVKGAREDTEVPHRVARKSLPQKARTFEPQTAAAKVTTQKRQGAPFQKRPCSKGVCPRNPPGP